MAAGRSATSDGEGAIGRRRAKVSNLAVTRRTTMIDVRQHPTRCGRPSFAVVPQDFVAHIFTVTLPHERCD